MIFGRNAHSYNRRSNARHMELQQGCSSNHGFRSRWRSGECFHRLTRSRNIVAHKIEQAISVVTMLQYMQHIQCQQFRDIPLLKAHLS